jgi:hypothetical protein
LTALEGKVKSGKGAGCREEQDLEDQEQ